VRVAPPGEPRKRTLDAGEAPRQPCPLAAIVILGERTHGEAELTPVVPVEALPALVPSLVFAGRDRLGVAMRQAAWLGSAVPVLRCRLPEGIERLPAAIDEVLGVILPAAGVSPAGA
jgi:hypothetical protein